MSTKTISLDLYNHNIDYIKAKQSDIGRNIKVICTDHGKRYYLNPSTTSAFIKYKKNDGTFSFNEAIVQDDGTIIVELTEQMLAIPGRQVFEIAIAFSTGLKVETLSSVQGFEDLGINIISTMPFYVNVVASVIDSSGVTSLSEFDALNVGIARLTATENQMSGLKQGIDNVVNDCKDATNKATASANNADIKAAAANTAASNANTKANAANTAANNANTQATAASNAASRTETAIANAVTATNAANNAATRFEQAINKEGLVLSTEKGSANGVASLNANAQIPSNQLPIVTSLTNVSSGKIMDAQALATIITQLNTTITNLHQVYWGTESPDNSVGKNGDIYMQILTADESGVAEVNETEGE